MPRKKLSNLSRHTRNTRMKRLKRRLMREMMINYYSSQVQSFVINSYPDNNVKTEPVVEYGTSSMLEIKEEKDAQDEFNDAISEAEIHGTQEAPLAARLDTEDYQNAFETIKCVTVKFKNEPEDS